MDQQQVPQNSTNPYGEDEISLIDLLAVLVRFRRIIIGGTALAGIIAAVVLYVFPMVGITEPQEEYVAQVRLVVNRIPEELEDFAPIDPGVLMQAVLTDARIVGEVYRLYNDDIDPDMTPERYLRMIRRDIVGNQLEIEWSERTRTMDIQWTDNNSERALEFVETLIEAATPTMTGQIRWQLQGAERSLAVNIESRIALARSVGTAVGRIAEGGRTVDEARVRELIGEADVGDISALLAAETALERAQGLLQDPSRLFTVATEPIVFEGDGQGRMVRMVVTLFTAFFLMVFVAFVLQYARTVRGDAEEMAKLRAAWRGE